MKIYNINYPNQTIYFTKNETVRKPQVKAANSPLHEGLTTAGAWFAFGVGLDFVARKCTFFKSPTKNSLALNSFIGIAAGIVACCKSKFSGVQGKKA